MFSHAVALTVASIIAFAAANIGDLIVLMLFFADQRFQPWQVVLGQYLGVSAVIGLCLLGAGPASHLPHMLISSARHRAHCGRASQAFESADGRRTKACASKEL